MNNSSFGKVQSSGESPSSSSEREAMNEKEWIEKARKIHKHHIGRVREKKAWILSQTAKELNISIGKVSEAILVISWLRTHEKELSKCDTMMEALEFIRERKRKLMTEDFDD